MNTLDREHNVDSLLSVTRAALDQLRAELLSQRTPAGHWEGFLSPSALSTATAISAISTVLAAPEFAGSHSAPSTSFDPATTFDRRQLIDQVTRGVGWCLQAQNKDGGFGDTDRSHSNIATTLLVMAALRLAGPHLDAPLSARCDQALQLADDFRQRAGGFSALRERYGKDKTFVIPILTNCALAGLVSWKEVQALPFELAAVPQSMYRAVRMPVVSYAIPALVAIGQARFFHSPPRNPVAYLVRRAAIERTMKVLCTMQPESGGYLEATPLTAFVLMSLAATGRALHQVSQRALQFLCKSMLPDGSWPIDTNLATWVTSLSMQALKQPTGANAEGASQPPIEWLLSCQHRQRHPFTGAEPGGWGWTDLSGAVPDGDDTPAAILALCNAIREQQLSPANIARGITAITDGLRWLLQLQNRDGGLPTFCRGWGKLPFDRSSTDLTAHALRAFTAALLVVEVSPSLRSSIDKATRRGWQFLQRQQRPDGSFLPLWFGNQDQPDDENPFYGTGRVLLACEALASPPSSMPQAQRMAVSELLGRACCYLVQSQNHDGGWGGGWSLTEWLDRSQRNGAQTPLIPTAEEKSGRSSAPLITSSVEETAVVLEGLAAYYLYRLRPPEWLAEDVGGIDPKFEAGKILEVPLKEHRAAIIRGMQFICKAVSAKQHQVPWPIGFYFAKLWYHERLYATIFATAALERTMAVVQVADPTGATATLPSASEKDPRFVDHHAVQS